MSSVYLIGSKAGPCYMGQGDRPETALAQAIIKFPDVGGFRLSGQWPLREPSAVELIIRVVRGWIKDDSEWLKRPERDMLTMIEEAYQLVVGGGPDPLGHGEFATALRAIREQDFGVSQMVMARLMGSSASTYSRWEAGDRVPDIRDLHRLRKFSRAAGLPWVDARIFDLAEAAAGERPDGQGAANGGRAR